MLFVFSRTPTSFIRMHSRRREITDPAGPGSRPIMEASSSLSLRPRSIDSCAASLIFLIWPGWLSFLSRPTTFLRDQNRGAPLFASLPPCSFCLLYFFLLPWSLFIRDFMLTPSGGPWRIFLLALIADVGWVRSGRRS